MTRFCPNCGTEVDETAVFCPTCGQPVDQAMETEMPPAPAWPEPAQPVEPEAPAAAAPEVPAPPAAERAAPPPLRPAPRVAPPPSATPAPSAGAPVQVTMPLTLSGWLIGVGAALAAVGALISLFDGVRTVVDLLVLVAMGGVAVSVFFESSMPAFGHTRLATLAIVFVALGAGADRILAGVGGAGELLLFIGAAAAVIGAIILEIGRDQPMGVAR